MAGSEAKHQEEEEVPIVEHEDDRVEQGVAEQVTFFTDNEEYYDALDVASNIHHGTLDQDERYWSS